MNIKVLGLIAVLLLVSVASAAPVTGVGHDITSNSFTVPVTGVVGDGWIAWGEASGNTNWASSTQTGDGDYVVWGAPIIGGSTVYYKACDSTGCGSERGLDILAITPIPTSNFGAAYTNLSARHFQIADIPRNLLPGYTYNGTPINVIWGIMMLAIFFGFWFRTRSVRLALIMGLLLAGLALTPTAGLYLGAPLLFQTVAQGLMAVCVAGLAISFIRK